MAAHEPPEKPRFCCLKRRALVYDTTSGSYTIKVDDIIRQNYEDYWPFQFGPPKTRSDSWDIFLDYRNDKALAVEPHQPPEGGVFLAGLQLNKLGIWGKLLRKAGVLSNGYSIRP
ncbi:hypothetical protein F5Y19DRAFT_444381 [Xylariaceae sp. FL1651]|nr:hypothetical protein F5Y19DRAFT_444381 [Xylariaceae sp. FL1651]